MYIFAVCLYLTCYDYVLPAFKSVIMIVYVLEYVV